MSDASPTQPVDSRTAALQIAVVKAMSSKLAELDKEFRKNAAGYFRRGDRLTVTSPADDDTNIATVSYTNPKIEAYVDNRSAFNAWMLAEYPDRCKSYPTIIGAAEDVVKVLEEHAPHLVTWDRRPAEWAVAELLQVSTEHGRPVGPGGEVDKDAPPGIAVGRKEPSVSVRLAQDAYSTVARLVREQRVDPLRELPPAS